MTAAVVLRAGLFSLVALMYASACGGPYGMEDFVPKVGPGLFLVLLAVTPVFWGLPTALATASRSGTSRFKEYLRRHPVGNDFSGHDRMTAKCGLTRSAASATPSSWAN